MKYKLQIVSGTDVRNTDLLNMASVGDIGHVSLFTSYGDFFYSDAIKPYTPNGVPVTTGQQYYIKGAKKVCFYSAVGIDENDWMSKFVSFYPESPMFDSQGQAFTVPAGASVMRFEGELGSPELTTDNFYLIAGSEPAQGFAPFKIWSQLDMGEDKPTMTYQTNDIAELKDRQADYSQELRLPLTAHNLTVLGLPDHVDSQTNFPYMTVECRLYADEYELAGRGAILLIDAVTDAIECQVLGSNANLFDILEDSPMSAITEPSFTRDYGGDLIPVNFPEGLEFVAASFTKGGFHHLLEMSPVYMLPVVNDIYLLGKILESHGYSWEHNLAGYEGTDKNALPVVRLDPDADSFDVFDTGASRTIAVSNPAGAKYYWITPLANNVGGLVYTFGVDGSVSEAGTKYKVPGKGTIRIALQLSWQAGSENHIWVYLNHTTPGETTTSLVEWHAVAGIDPQPTPYNQVIEVEEGDELTLMLQIGQYSLAKTLTLSMQLTDFISDTVPLYGLVHAPRNLGFETQFDYFKAFVQRYGLTVRVDHATSTVYTYTMKQIYDNKAFARDWSDKLVERGREMSFRAEGYARTNRIKLKDNEEDGVKNEAGEFTVLDETLEKEKDLFEIPIEAGLDWGVTTKYASIPVFEVPDIGDEIINDVDRLLNARYEGGNAHLLRVSTDNVSLFVPIFGEDRDYHRVTHVTAQSLIDTYYSELADSMLVKAKRLVCNFHLTPADIEAFDPFVPVYLRQYGAYFYVNKISNFIAGRPTSVELIKL
jgi:hypothetical protein